MTILDNAEAHFAAKRELREIKVPEWEGSVFFYDPPSVRDRCAILECFDRKEGGFNADVMVVAFMARAWDKDGMLLFKQAGWAEQKKTVLDKFDPDVIERFVMEMGGVYAGLGNVTLEDAEKN
jgi:hypothetical protein